MSSGGWLLTAPAVGCATTADHALPDLLQVKRMTTPAKGSLGTHAVLEAYRDQPNVHRIGDAEPHDDAGGHRAPVQQVCWFLARMS